MKDRTLQEWADFTGLVIACFDDGGKYVWRGIEPSHRPYCYMWIQYNEAVNNISVPMDFYKKYKWDMTKDLVRDRYNSVFVPNKNGDTTYVDGSTEKAYIVGTLVDTKSYFLVPIKAKEWSKKIYYPSQQ